MSLERRQRVRLTTISNINRYTWVFFGGTTNLAKLSWLAWRGRAWQGVVGRVPRVKKNNCKSVDIYWCVLERGRWKRERERGEKEGGKSPPPPLSSSFPLFIRSHSTRNRFSPSSLFPHSPTHPQVINGLLERGRKWKIMLLLPFPFLLLSLNQHLLIQSDLLTGRKNGENKRKGR